MFMFIRSYEINDSYAHNIHSDPRRFKWQIKEDEEQDKFQNMPQRIR